MLSKKTLNKRKTTDSCMGKLLTSTLDECLHEYSDAMHVINENQVAFRRAYSTLSHLTEMCN